MNSNGGPFPRQELVDAVDRVWRGAPPMVQLQEDLLDEMISLDGQELADIVAFVHDAEVQAGIGKEDVPTEFVDLIP